MPPRYFKDRPRIEPRMLLLIPVAVFQNSVRNAEPRQVLHATDFRRMHPIQGSSEVREGEGGGEEGRAVGGLGLQVHFAEGALPIPLRTWSYYLKSQNVIFLKIPANTNPRNSHWPHPFLAVLPCQNPTGGDGSSVSSSYLLLLSGIQAYPFVEESFAYCHTFPSSSNANKAFCISIIWINLACFMGLSSY